MERLKKKLIGRKRGFTLIELLMVVAIIGILAAIAMPIYANMQAKARAGQAQSDVATLAEAFSAFAAHCGDVPASGYPGAAAGTGVCATELAGTGVGPLTAAGGVTDANGITSGPWLRVAPVAPTGWAYAFTRNGVANFTVTGTDPGGVVRITKP